MEHVIEAFLTDDHVWNAQFDDPDAALDAWWFRLHAIMILGLMSSRVVGFLLVKALERTGQDVSLENWCAGYWSALFRNKFSDVLLSLEAASRHRDTSPYVRVNMIEAIVSVVERSGSDALDQALASVARIAEDESENRDFRLLLGGVLLDFLRPQHSALLDDLALMQGEDIGLFFDADDIERVYAEMRNEPEWSRFADRWQFYSFDGSPRVSRVGCMRMRAIARSRRVG